MKKTCKTLIVALLVITVAISSCKKEEDPGNNNNNNPIPLCDGVTGSTSWLPLALNNQWKYGTSTGGITKTVTAMDTFSGVAYFRVFNQEGSFNDWTRWYRVDNNGDVYYRNSNGDEYLYLPATPAVNQQWAYPAGFFGIGSRVVKSLTDTVKTASCTYTNVMRIQEYDNGGNEQTTFYYKRGFGKVRQQSFSPYDVTAVTFR